MYDAQFNPHWFRSLLLMAVASLTSPARAARHVDDAMPDLGRIRPPPANNSAPARRKVDELLQLPATNISLAAKLT